MIFVWAGSMTARVRTEVTINRKVGQNAFHFRGESVQSSHDGCVERVVQYSQPLVYLWDQSTKLGLVEI